MNRLSKIIVVLALVIQAWTAGAATPMVSVGYDHSLALLFDGTVLAWGSDTYGQLGVNRPLISTVPVKVPGLSNVAKIGAGQYYSFAVLQNGTVWAWGLNSSGQLGDGTTVNRPSPVQVVGVTNAVMACGGWLHSAAMIGDGTVWTWGTNTAGQLGNGTPEGAFLSSPPGPVPGLSGVVAIACAGFHTVALRDDGTVWDWGQNTSGELGDGTTIDRLQPVQVSGLNNVVAINGTAALKQDGTVWEWGDNSCCGQPVPNYVPVQSAGIAGAVKLSLSFGSVFGTNLEAIKSDGMTWWQWGAGATPVVQTPVGNLAAIASGPYLTLLLKVDGTVLAAGLNNNGQLGDGIAPSGGFDFRADFLPVIGISSIEALAAGDIHALALDANGDVWAWGDDAYGELGRGAILTNTVPGVVPGLSNIVEVNAGWGTSSAVDTSGNLWTWGNNDSGQLGDGSGVNQSAPVLAAIQNVQTANVGAGPFTSASIALKRDGTVWTWGNNFSDQLGNGNAYVNGVTGCCSNLPAQVPGLAGITAVAASYHMLVVRQDGTVWAWGANDSGELGMGTTVSSPVPTQIPGLSGVTAVAAAEHRSVALQSNGNLLVWGEGPLGDGGYGTATGQLTPAPVSGLTNVVAISTSADFTLAQRMDGSVWGWGNTFGSELGSNPGLLPASIENLDSMQGISAGSGFSALLGTNGLLYMGGINTSGQLGDGTFAQYADFVLAVSPGLNGYLNLNTGTTTNVAASLSVPFFVSSTGGISTDSATVMTTINYNAQDQGKTGSVYITAVVPPGSPLASQFMATGARLKTTNTSALQTVQLTQNGWQPVVNGQLIPFTTGVLGATSAALQILNGTNTAQLAGAQFCVGYSAGAWATVTSRTVATIPAAGTAAAAGTPPSCTSAAATITPQTGFWYNPAESGRGYFLEYNGTKIFMATYLYDPSGRSTWYSAGPTPLAGTSFSTPMTAYAGGQTLTGSYVPPTLGQSPGSLVIDFSDAADATMSWPGGQVPLTRFQIVPGGLSSTPTATQPQTGWWYNPNEAGRGYAIEVQDNTAFIAAYMYDASGNPVWYDSGPAALTANNTFQGNWTSNTGGQTLTGTYHPPTGATNAGSLTIQFASPTAGTLTLPNGNQIPIQRFGF